MAQAVTLAVAVQLAAVTAAVEAVAVEVAA
jgi:hypothetical protein